MKNKAFVLMLAVILLACSHEKDTVCSFADQKRVEIGAGVLVLDQDSGRKISTESAAAAVDIRVCDTSLVFSRFSGDYRLVSINKETLAQNGAFARNGRGPGEVTGLIALADVSRSPDGRYLLGYQDAAGNWIRVDLQESLVAGSPQIIETIMAPKDFQSRFQKAYVGDGRFIGVCLVDDRTRLERSIQGGSADKTVNDRMGRLNAAHIVTRGSGFAFDLLGTIIGYNPELKRVVEASTFLNTIHLYDLETRFARTLVLGKRPDDIARKEQELLESGDVMSMLQAASMRAYRDCFAVMYHDGTLCLFDWSGKLLKAYRLMVPVTAFDIDWEENTLYTLDTPSEEVWCFEML